MPFLGFHSFEAQDAFTSLPAELRQMILKEILDPPEIYDQLKRSCSHVNQLGFDETVRQIYEWHANKPCVRTFCEDMIKAWPSLQEDIEYLIKRRDRRIAEWKEEIIDAASARRQNRMESIFPHIVRKWYHLPPTFDITYFDEVEKKKTWEELQAVELQTERNAIGWCYGVSFSGYAPWTPACLTVHYAWSFDGDTVIMYTKREGKAERRMYKLCWLWWESGWVMEEKQWGYLLDGKPSWKTK